MEVSGTAADAISTRAFIETAGDVGLAGSARSWGCVQETVGVGPARDVFITALGKRLGDCTAVPKQMTVIVDRGLPSEATIAVTFDQDYRAWTNVEVLAAINDALVGHAVAAEYDVEGRYRPFFADEERQLRNTSATTILMGMALATDEGGARTVRPMTASDPIDSFVGVAWEDVRPGAYGRVKSGGWLPTTDLLRADGGSPEVGTCFRIDDAQPGYVRSGVSGGTGILPVLQGSLGNGLWTVAVDVAMNAQGLADLQTAIATQGGGSAGTDPDGFADWYADESGMIVSGKRLQIGDLVIRDDNPGRLVILDPDGFVMFDSDDIQGTAAPTSDASVYAARDAANVAYAMSGQNDLMPIVQQIERGKVNIILTYGQSLRRSSRGYPPLTTTQPAYSDTHVFSFGQACRPADDDDTDYEPVTSAALYPLLAVPHYNDGTLIDNALLETIGPDTAVPGESVSISAAYWLRQQCLAKWGVQEDPDTPFVVLDCAVGGRSVAHLMKGANPNIYNRIPSGLTQIRDLPAFAGKEFVLAGVDWGQGENDYHEGLSGANPTVESYGGAVEQVIDDIYADTLAIFNNGQKRPAVFVAQAGGAFTTDATNLHVGQAQLNLVTQVDGYFPTGPNYPVVNVASAHPDNNGYRWLGQYCGRAWASVLVHGRRPNIVYPRSATWNAATNEVIIDFVSTGGPISEGHPYDGFTAQTVANLGISAKYGSTILPLSNVRLVGAMTVAATLLVTPAGAPLIQIGTKALDNGYIGIRCASRMVAPESYTFIPNAGQDPAANVPALVGKPYNLDDWCWAASLQSEEI